MALALYDRVQETTTTSGTGSVTLLGAVAGFQTFAAVGNGNTCYYTITDGTAWEVGIGTYSTTGPTLARTTVLSNSNADTSPITLSSSSNTKSVFLTYPAEKSVNLDGSGNVSPLGTVASGTWQGSTIGVSYGGTGVTASSGPNSVVLRDGFGNITGFNNFVVGSTFITATGGTTVLTDASAQIQAVVGSTTHTIRLPQATTITVGQYYTISNNSTGLLTIVDNASTTITTIAQGGAAQVLCANNSTSAGSWVVRVFAASNVKWGNATLDYNGAITSAEWQGDTVQPGYGGTGLTTFTGANNALYSTGASALTAGTLPVLAGGTGNTTGQAESVAHALTAGTGISFSAGTTYNGSAAITINNSGVSAYPGAGIAVSTGSAWGTSKTSPTGDLVGTTDTQTLSGKTITGTKETVYAITDGAAFEIDPANGGIQTITLTASRTPAATNFTAGQSVTLMVNDGTAYTLTWTTVNPTWVGGSAPTLATSGYTVLEFWKVGSTIYGAYVGTVA